MTAKVFTNGRSQAIRIPKEYRFEDDEIYISKLGDSVILTPKKSAWANMILGAEMMDKDLFDDEIKDEKPQSREKL